MLLIADMLEAIRCIEQYTGQYDFESCSRSALLRHAVERNLEIVGEAVVRPRKRPPKIVDKNPDVPWNEAAARQNRVSHASWDLTHARIWDKIGDDLPSLEARLERPHGEPTQGQAKDDPA